MGSLLSKCAGDYFPKERAEEKSEPRGACIIVYHRRKGRWPNAFASRARDAALKQDGKFEDQNGRSGDCQTHSEENGENGNDELSADITSQRNGEVVSSFQQRVQHDNGSYWRSVAYTGTNASAQLEHSSPTASYNTGTGESDDVFRIHDHHELWNVLSGVPGWERDVHEGITNVVEGYANFHKWTENAKRNVWITSYRLPWPELYTASADHLLGFVKMVNTSMQSGIFELRFENLRIPNSDQPPFVMDSVIDFPRVSPTLVRHWSETAWAAAAECPGVTGQRNVPSASLPSIYGSVSQAAGSSIGAPLDDIRRMASAVEPWLVDRRLEKQQGPAATRPPARPSTVAPQRLIIL